MTPTPDSTSSDGRAAASTVAAALTAAGRGAIAVIAVDGPAAHRCVGDCFEPATPLAVRSRASATFPINAIRYGRWLGPLGAGEARGGRSGESVVVVATATDRIEVHCHGGRAAVAAILDDLAAVGAETADADALQLRHGASAEQLEMGRILAATSTVRTAAIALDQTRGAMRRFTASIRSQLVGSEVAASEHALEVVRPRIGEVLDRVPLGLHLVEPWNIVLAGPPNVGKSSLLNALLGYDRAITFAAPGTTRDVVSADSAIDGWPVRMSDTAGVRETSDVLESEGVSRALQTLIRADLVLLVIDMGEGMTATHRTIAARTSAPCLTVRNKADLHEPDRSHWDDAPFDVSATRGTGIDRLVAGIGRALVPRPPAPGDPVPVTELQRRFLRAALEAPTVAQCLAALEPLGC